MFRQSTTPRASSECKHPVLMLGAMPTRFGVASSGKCREPSGTGCTRDSTAGSSVTRHHPEGRSAFARRTYQTHAPAPTIPPHHPRHRRDRRRGGSCRGWGSGAVLAAQKPAHRFNAADRCGAGTPCGHGARELYVADLDAIRWGVETQGVPRCWRESIASCSSIRGESERQPAAANVREIYALECRMDSEKYRRHAQTEGAIFSIDLRDGRLVDGWQDWGLTSPLGTAGLVRKAYDLGYRAFIILDLARVGLGKGSGTDELLRTLRDEYPDVELIAGGGVKTRDDITRLGEAGADAVLVASAIHDGTLGGA